MEDIVSDGLVSTLEEDIKDLAAFTGVPASDCRRRIMNAPARATAALWLDRYPRTASEILSFYCAAEPYLWELVAWHHSPSRRKYGSLLAYVAEHFPPQAGYRRVLDFGCGIGSDALCLAKYGYDVTLMDVEGPAFRFAQYRFAQRRVPAQFVESSWPIPRLAQTYDLVVAFDVFEHLPDPMLAVRTLIASLRSHGIFVQTTDFGEEIDHPMHLHANTLQFSGPRWNLWLTSLPLRSWSEQSEHIYEKIKNSVVRYLRFLLWRSTGVYVGYLPSIARDYGAASLLDPKGSHTKARGGDLWVDLMADVSLVGEAFVPAAFSWSGRFLP